MLGQTLQNALIERLGPEGIKQVYLWLQIGAGALITGGLLWLRTKPTESAFAVREAELQKERNKARAKGTRPGGLAESRMELKRPLSLPGIRIDGPPHEILGIAPGATEVEIQRAYRDRMKQYHPDKVGAQGSREWVDAQKIAEAINRAKIEMLKRTRSAR